jgi:hypothetical protein
VVSYSFGLPTSAKVVTVVRTLAHASGGSASNTASVSAFDNPERSLPTLSSCTQANIHGLASHPSRSFFSNAVQSPLP